MGDRIDWKLELRESMPGLLISAPVWVGIGLAAWFSGAATLPAVIGMSLTANAIFTTGAALNRNGNLIPSSLFRFLGRHIADLRPLPITAEDFAVAHWGTRLLHERAWRKAPALALRACTMELIFRLESCSGWSYYPSTFGIKINDKLERHEVPMDDSGRPLWKDEFALPPEEFDYRTRLDYLAALWGEYLEVWQPDQPAEAEWRRSILPSRAHRVTEEKIRQADRIGEASETQ